MKKRMIPVILLGFITGIITGRVSGMVRIGTIPKNDLRRWHK